MHGLHYTPLAKQDLSNIVSYIASDLHSPAAARKLLNAIEAKVKHLQQFPYAYSLYRSQKPLQDEFRRMSVGNYLVLYVVEDSTVEIRRVLYGGRDIGVHLD